MKYVLLVSTSLIAIVAQMVASHNFILFNFLDLSLILVTYWGMYRSRNQALFVGSLTGLLMDAVLGWPLGFNGFAKTLAAYLVGQAARRFNLEGVSVRFALIGTCSMASSISIFLLFELFQRSSNKMFLSASMLQAVITAGAGILVLSAMDSYRAHRAS